MERFVLLRLPVAMVATQLLFGVLHSIKTSGELGTALHFVPATSRSILRFPEKGSEYYGRLQNFKSVVFNENETGLLVAARDAVFTIDVGTFRIKNGNSSSDLLFLPANSEDYAKCYKFMLEKIECNNTMLFAVYYGSNIFACGTYSRKGRCWLLSRKNMKVLKVVPGEFSDNNEFAPKKPSGKIVGLTASNGVIFGAIEKDNSHTIRAIVKNNVHIKTGSPAVQLAAPTFVASFEADDGFIYFFFTENAYEVSERQFDKGSLSALEFITFTKSQIVCYKQGRVPDYYDHIQSVTTVEVHDKNGNPEVFVYASFTTTMRSTGSSALCRYKLKDIQKLFQTSKYYVRKTENGIVKYEAQDHPQPKLDVSRMKCDSKLKSDEIKGEGVRWISLNPLLYKDIEPYDKNTVATFRGERVTSLAVEDVHQEVNKTDLGVHVLFAGTDSGKVLKGVMNGSNTGEPYLAEEIQATEKPATISSLALQKNYVICSGDTIPLIRISKERCESKYLMCSDCLKARDPYCAWSFSMKKCTRAADLTPLDRLQDVASGSDRKCPPVDVTISCSLVIVDNFPGAWTTIQCTGHGKISPQVVAWKKDEARLDIDRNIYEIRRQNDSSQLLVIKGYTAKELGKYGCIVGLNSNKSECSVHIKGQKPQVNCTTNSSVYCTCHVSAHPSPTVKKVINSNETLGVDHHASPITIQQGDILFAFNTFGDDVFACPVSMATTTKLPTTTLPATTVPTTTTAATTTTTRRLSTTQTTSTKSTSRKSSSRASTAKPTTVKITRKTTGKVTKKQVTIRSTVQETTKRSLQTTSVKSTETTVNPPTPGPRVNCPKDQSEKWFVAFVVCLVFLILIIAANVFLFCCFVWRRKEYPDEEDEFDGTKGTLDISPSKKPKRDHRLNPTVLFQKRRRVEKKDSTKPLVKRESNNGRAHSDPDDSGKTAKEMDDISPSEDKPNVYLMHVKT